MPCFCWRGGRCCWLLILLLLLMPFVFSFAVAVWLVVSCFAVVAAFAVGCWLLRCFGCLCCCLLLPCCCCLCCCLLAAWPSLLPLLDCLLFVASLLLLPLMLVVGCFAIVSAFAGLLVVCFFAVVAPFAVGCWRLRCCCFCKSDTAFPPCKGPLICSGPRLSRHHILGIEWILAAPLLTYLT